MPYSLPMRHDQPKQGDGQWQCDGIVAIAAPATMASCVTIPTTWFPDLPPPDNNVDTDQRSAPWL
jgi:hypothetical protein